MQFAFVDSCWVQYSIAVLDDRVQYRAATLHGFERFDLANAEQSIRSTFKAKK
jgi:hypothetical protein